MFVRHIFSYNLFTFSPRFYPAFIIYKNITTYFSFKKKVWNHSESEPVLDCNLMLDMIRFWSNFFHENPLDIGEIVKNKFMRHFQNKADIFYFMFFLSLCSDHLSKIASSILTLFNKCTIPSQYSHPDIKKMRGCMGGRAVLNFPPYR